MLKRLIFFLVSALSASIFAEKIENGIIDPMEVEFAAPKIANLEGEPSSFVAGCVNALSGDFCDLEVDLSVPGSQPFIFQRSYISSSGSKGSLGHGWNHNHFAQIHLSKYDELDKKKYKAESIGSMGRLLRFSGKRKKKGYSFLSVPIDFLWNGITNCSSSEISGRTNLKNSYIKCSSDERLCCLSNIALGMQEFLRKGSTNIYLINKENQSNGNTIYYKYFREKGKKNLIKEVLTKNAQEQNIFKIGFIYPEKKILKKKQELIVFSSDGRSIKYSYSKLKREFATGREKVRYYLTEVTRPNAPALVYHYGKKKCQIIQKNWPEGRYFAIDYYNDKKYYVNNKTIKVKESSSVYRKVFRVKAPVGQDSTPITTHSFIYHFPKNEFHTGYTEVFDALNRKTIYIYTGQFRLSAIKKFDKNGDLYAKESFSWGTMWQTNLCRRRLEQSDGKVVFLRNYIYDYRGNIIKSQLYGNCSGKNDSGVLLKNFMPMGGEHFDVEYEYSKENLMISEYNGKKTILYSYYPKTDLMASRLVTADGEMRIRHFYEYDVNGAMTSEIIDDGRSDNKDDLNGVTERRIKRIRNSMRVPVGLPEEIKEMYLSNGDEVLLKKIVNTYSVEGYIIQQDYYDNCDKFIYSFYWEYDNLGNVILETDALNQTITRKYDKNGNLIFEKGPREDSHKEYTYDLSNRLICEEEVLVDGTNLVKAYNYDYLGNRISVTDFYGNETLYEYDAFGRVTKVVYPEIANKDGELSHPVVETEYDILSNPIKKIDPRGSVTESKFTVHGKPYFIKNPDGTEENLEYNFDGTLKKSILKNGLVVSYEYDYLARLVKKETYTDYGECLYSESWVYNAFRLIKEIDRKGCCTCYYYDPAGRMIGKVKGQSKEQYIYDSLGRNFKTFEYFSCDYSVKVCEYDLLNRLVEEKIEDSDQKVLSKVRYDYDEQDNRIQVCTFHREGVGVTETCYNSHKKPVQVIDAEGNKTVTVFSYSYRNRFDQGVSYEETTDPCGSISVTIYDPFCRVISLIRKNPFGEEIQKRDFIYDGSGNRTQVVESVLVSGELVRKITTVWEYDLSNREIVCMEAFGTVEQKRTRIKYNLFGQKETLVKPNGTKIEHEYDFSGNLNHLYSSDSSVDYSYEYDVNNNPTNIVDHINNNCTQRIYCKEDRLVKEILGNSLVVQYIYDRMGRPIRLLLPDQSSVDYVYDAAFLREVRRDSYIHSYQYDLSGNIIKTNLIGKAGEVFYNHDFLNRIVSVESEFWKEKLTLDPIGNITKKIRKNCTLEYTYDDLYQVKSEEGSKAYHYLYDSVYNRINKNGDTYLINNLSQVLSDGVNEYFYNVNGDLIEKKTEEGSVYYKYDALDRLTSVVTHDQRVCYQYDELNRRLFKEIFHWKGYWDLKSRNRYIYQGQNEVGVCCEDGSIEELRILGKGLGAEIGAAVAIELKGQVFAPIHDYNGNVMSIISAETGAVFEKYSYSAYGEELAIDFKNPWRFSSKRYDSETEFIYFGRRYYDPSLGRWITADPLGYSAGPNLYAYVMNRPSVNFDMYGLIAWSRLAAFASSLLSFPGKMIQLIGNHMIPIPFFRNIVSLTGHLLSGQYIRTFEPSYKQRHSNNYNLSKPEFSADETILLINGVMNSFEDVKRSAEEISRKYGGNNVHFTYNASHGFITDVFECIAQMVGVRTNSIDQLAIHLRERIEAVGGVGNGGIVRTIAHSQGGLILYRALEQLSPEEKKMIYAVTYGSAKIIPSTGLGEAVNYISTRDAVPFVADTFGIIKSFFNKSSNVQFVQSNSIPFIDHSFNNSNYQYWISEYGQDFKQKYGV